MSMASPNKRGPGNAEVEIGLLLGSKALEGFLAPVTAAVTSSSTARAPSIVARHGREGRLLQCAAAGDEPRAAPRPPSRARARGGHAAALRAMDWRAAHGNRVISMGRAVLAVERHDRRWRCGVQPRAQRASAFAF